MDKTEQLGQIDNRLENYFGLNSDPFSHESSVFYEGAQRMHNIETLRHLAIFGDMVLLLTGEKGAGKTTLIERFSILFGSELTVMSMSACADVSTSSSILRLAMLSHLHLIESEPARQTLTRLIQKYEVEFQQHGRRTLFMIDDAERLPKEEIRLYFSVFRDLPPESGVVVLLVGLPSLVEYAVSGSNIGRAEWVHQIQLKPFSESEVSDYLEQRLQSAGYTEKLTLSSNQSQQLNDMGKGLPGRINKIFGDVVSGLDSMPKDEHRQGNVNQRVLYSIAILLLCSFIFVSYQHGLFDLTTRKPIDEVTMVKKMELRDQVQLENERRAEALNASLKKRQEPESLIDEKPNMVLDAVISTSDESSNEPMVAEQNVDEELHLQLSTSSSNNRVQEKKEPAIFADQTQRNVSQNIETPLLPQEVPEPTVVVEKLVKKQPSPTYLKPKSWVVSQPSSSYSAQVLGSYKEGTAIAFIENSKAVKNELVYLKTAYKGKPWYIVLYGLFPSKAEAKNALTNAPGVIKKEKPWLRSFAGILDTYPK